MRMACVCLLVFVRQMDKIITLTPMHVCVRVYCVCLLNMNKTVFVIEIWFVALFGSALVSVLTTIPFLLLLKMYGDAQNSEQTLAHILLFHIVWVITNKIN